MVLSRDLKMKKNQNKPSYDKLLVNATECFLLMCEYVNCDTDSMQGRRIKEFLDKKFKRNKGTERT